jgi:hypothetical protein
MHSIKVFLTQDIEYNYIYQRLSQVDIFVPKTPEDAKQLLSDPAWMMCCHKEEEEEYFRKKIQEHGRDYLIQGE